MTADEKLAAILAAVQTDPGDRGLGRVPGDNLFTACAGDFAAACRRIADDPGSGVALFTGFFIPTGTPPAAETDGPLGVVLLAKTLSLLGYTVAILVDKWAENALLSGLPAKDGSEYPATILTVPPPSHPWSAFTALDWHSCVRLYGISHLICIERVGPSRNDGRCYSMRGRDITLETAPIHHLIEESQRIRPALHTVGIGDGGNEIGMGKIGWGCVSRNIPNGDIIACRVPTDHLIVAGVSNWGAYALAAGLFVLRGIKPPPGLFDADREREILEVMVRDGPLVDGVTGKQTATVDGLSWDEYAEPLRRIAAILGAD